MTDERLDAWLGELRNELSAAPSARLAAGIRVRVAASRRSYPVRLAMAATIAAIAVGSAATFWFRTSTITPAVEQRSVASILQASAPPVPSVVPEAAGATSTAVRRGPRHQPPPLETAAVASDLPRVLAPPDQGIALRRLLVSLRAGRGAVPPSQASNIIDSLPELEALVMTPLKIDPLDAVSAGGSGRKTP